MADSPFLTLKVRRSPVPYFKPETMLLSPPRVVSSVMVAFLKVPGRVMGSRTHSLKSRLPRVYLSVPFWAVAVSGLQGIKLTRVPHSHLPAGSRKQLLLRDLF